MGEANQGAQEFLPETKPAPTPRGAGTCSVSVAYQSRDFALSGKPTHLEFASKTRCILPRTGMSKLLCPANLWLQLEAIADDARIDKNTFRRAAS
jgi:hypothetical protein